MKEILHSESVRAMTTGPVPYKTEWPQENSNNLDEVLRICKFHIYMAYKLSILYMACYFLPPFQ